MSQPPPSTGQDSTLGLSSDGSTSPVPGGVDLTEAVVTPPHDGSGSGTGGDRLAPTPVPFTRQDMDRLSLTNPSFAEQVPDSDMAQDDGLVVSGTDGQRAHGRVPGSQDSDVSLELPYTPRGVTARGLDLRDVAVSDFSPSTASHFTPPPDWDSRDSEPSPARKEWRPIQVDRARAR